MGVYVALWMAIMSVTGAVVCAHDKRAARRGARRVPERALWTLAALGGACGVLLPMLALRHKTRKARFAVLMPLLAAVQVALLVWLCVRAPEKALVDIAGALQYNISV